MAGPTKKLTVSYGVFSCTLEGFDDPYETLKAVTQHFRDLSTADRHFGSELPALNSELLQRMIEREIEMRVDARVNNGGIYLNAAEVISGELPAIAPDAETAPSGAPREDDGGAHALGRAPETARPASARALADAPANDNWRTTGSGEIPGDKLAARLAAIRAAVSSTAERAERGSRPAGSFAPEAGADDSGYSGPVLLTEEARVFESGDEALPSPGQLVRPPAPSLREALRDAITRLPEGPDGSVAPNSFDPGKGAADEQDPKVHRLMVEADSIEAEPDHLRRRTAIEHLRAAVAATRADGPANGDGDNRARPYRDDLRRAFGNGDGWADPEQPGPVRPRRPMLPEGREREPRHAAAAARDTLTPLVLGSAQRIDMHDLVSPQPAGAGPVRPRRVKGIRANATSEKANTPGEPEPGIPQDR